MSRKAKRRTAGHAAAQSENATVASPVPARPVAGANRVALHHVLRTFAFMAVLYGAYYYPYPPGSLPERWIGHYLVWQAGLSGALIQVFDKSARVAGTEIHGAYALQIVKDCSSLDAQALLLAAMLAFPARWPRKLVGIVLGAATLVTANLIRIASLYFVGAHAPKNFDAIHEELMPLMLVAIACACFGGWAAWAHRGSSQAHEAT